MSDETPEELERAILSIQAELEALALPAPTDTELTEASKERIKLRSQYANGMAISLFAVGVLGPIVAIMGSDNISTSRLTGLVLTGIVCFGLSVVLHLYATKNLGELDQ